MSKSFALAADPSWLASLRLRSGARLRRANSAPVLPRPPSGISPPSGTSKGRKGHQGSPRPPSGISPPSGTSKGRKGHRGLPRVARVVAAPRDPGGSTAIFDRFTHSRALTAPGKPNDKRRAIVAATIHNPAIVRFTGQTAEIQAEPAFPIGALSVFAKQVVL